MPTVSVASLKIAYRREGEGPPLVLLHGGASGGRERRRQLADLRDELTVVAWDEPGAGASSDPRKGFGLPDFADSLATSAPGEPLPRDERAELWPGLFSAAAPAKLHDELADIAADARPTSVRRTVVEIAACDNRGLLPRIRVPTLLVWGADDARSPLRVAEQFRAAIPGAKLVVIPGAGHMSSWEQPARFNAAIREFCRATPLAR